MSERRIYKYQGTLIGDNRVDNLVSEDGQINVVTQEKFDELVKVVPTDINVDTELNLILEHDGKEITKQKKVVNHPIVIDELDTIGVGLDVAYASTSIEGQKLAHIFNIATNSKSGCAIVCEPSEQYIYLLQCESAQGNEVYWYQVGNLDAIATHWTIAFDADNNTYKMTETTETPITSENADQMTKTLFGDNHIYGSGNIDLFCHFITVQDSEGNVDALFTFYSSKNLKCDSLNDLKTLLGNTFTWPCNGIVKDGSSVKVVYKVTETALVFTDSTTRVHTGVTFSDTVKTI